MPARTRGLTVTIDGDTTGLTKALADVNKEVKNTQAQLKDVVKLLKLDPTNTELLSQKQRLLGDAIGQTRSKLDTLKIASDQANISLQNGEISQAQYDALQREIIETTEELRRLEEQAKQSSTAVQEIAAKGEKLKTMGDNVTDVGKKMLPATVAIAGLGTAAVKTAADFDSGMSRVSAIVGQVTDEDLAAAKQAAQDMGLKFKEGADNSSTALNILSAKAREMGATTKFSASEASDAMNYMAMAGWKTTDMLSGIEGVMNLAAASGEDLATTSDIVTDALTAFGLSAQDSSHFADILAAASSNANTNVSLMGETFKYAAPIAGALGYSAEDTALAIGLMGTFGSFVMLNVPKPSRKSPMIAITMAKQPSRIFCLDVMFFICRHLQSNNRIRRSQPQAYACESACTRRPRPFDDPSGTGTSPKEAGRVLWRTQPEGRR